MMRTLTILALSGLVALAILPACSRKEAEHQEIDGLTNPPPDPPTGPAGTFLMVGDMLTARKNHRAVALASGDVLVLGGENGTGNVLDTAELYEYGNGVFLGLPLAVMANGRVDFSASVLGDGRVLACGGNDGTTVVDTADLFDPSTFAFTATGSVMTTPRRGHAALALANGAILLSGGIDQNGTVLSSIEVYDWSSDAFFPGTNTMSTARWGHSATLLDNGDVLIAGGVDASGNPLASAEVYTPGTGLGDAGTFAATDGPLPAAVALHQAIKIPTGAFAGQVLLLGGNQGPAGSPTPTGTAVAYDPLLGPTPKGMFATVTDTMAAPRLGFTATLLTGGDRLLVAGGTSSNVPEILNPYAGTAGTLVGDCDFSRTQDGSGTDTAMTETLGRTAHAAAWLPNGTVLLCGGEAGAVVTKSAEIYNP